MIALPAAFAWLALAAPPPPPADGGGLDAKPPDDESGDKLKEDELKPDPYDDRIDEDEGEPVPPLGLPEEGEALRPALPYMERDLVAPRSHPAGRGAAQVSLTSIGEDTYLALNVGYVFQVDKWRIAPRLALRFRIDDAPPVTDDVIRSEDYDEVSDFARLLSFVQYGQVGDPLVLRYGELNGVTIGHGSIVNRYFNTIDIDHYQGGVYAFGDTGLIGAEGLVNDLFGPDVMVARVFVRPFHMVKDLALPLSGLKIGLTLGADFAAPTAVAEEDGRLFATPEWEPEVLGDRVLAMWGMDVEVPLVSSRHVDLVPYVDVATLDFDSIGLHVGTYLNLRFTRKTTLRTRVELRTVGPHHEPGYVSPFYEIERISYLGGEPKLAALEHDPLFAHAWSGVHLEADLKIENVLAWSLVLTSSGRRPGLDLLTRLKLPNLGPVRLTLFLARLGFDDFDDLFDNERTVAGVSARVMVYGPFFLRGRLVKEWWLARDEDGASQYGTVVDWDLGAGILFEF
ncbi:MAG: hypothetical protein U1F43_26840 [Myxococcota bacterium]